MPLTPEQIKDLMPFKAEEYQMDGKFFIKQDNGEFHIASITQWEVNRIKKNKPWLLEQLRWEFKELERMGKLWRRINKPWQSFAYDKK